jgi:hypothetical protein
VTPSLDSSREKPAPESATYLYCLIQSARAPSLRGAPQSIPGAGPPRVILIDRGIWAVVSDVPLERFSGERLERDLQDLEVVSRHALAHASVVEFFFRRFPVIPLKMFTLFSVDEKARAHLLPKRARLERLFAEVLGLEEWGVRIIAGEPGLAAGRRLGQGRSQKPLSGRDYLHAKKRLKNQRATPRAIVREVTGALRSLGRMATKTRKEAFPPPGAGRPFVTGASFLVKAKRREQWKKEVARLAASLEARGHRLEMSGPWPPYHFASK